MKNNASKTKTAALCGMLTALICAFMFFGTLVPFLTYTLPAVCGVAVLVAALALNKKSALLVFACSAVLSLLLLPDKECAIIYLAFFGYYPILKFELERKFSPKLAFLLKVIVFNASMVLSQFVVVYVLGIPFFDGSFPAEVMVAVMLIAANLLLVMYDFVLKQFLQLYKIKLKAVVDKLLK